MKRAAKHEITPLLGDQSIGLEARLSSDDHHSLRLWLRLLACSTDIETEIRKRLRASHGMTLARFDYLAQLHRHPDGLRMSALSRFLMVTGGNVTGLTDELEKDGLVQRDAEPGDRRSLPRGAHGQGPQGLREDRRGARALGGRDVRRHERCRAAAALHLLGRLRVQLSAHNDNTEGRTMSHEHRPLPARRQPQAQAGYRAEHFLWSVRDGVGTITLNRPERKNPLTFASYAELRDLFQRCAMPTTSRWCWCRARAATSAPAATCTRSSAR